MCSIHAGLTPELLWALPGVHSPCTRGEMLIKFDTFALLHPSTPPLSRITWPWWSQSRTLIRRTKTLCTLCTILLSNHGFLLLSPTLSLPLFSLPSFPILLSHPLFSLPSFSPPPLLPPLLSSSLLPSLTSPLLPPLLLPSPSSPSPAIKPPPSFSHFPLFSLPSFSSTPSFPSPPSPLPLFCLPCYQSPSSPSPPFLPPLLLHPPFWLNRTFLQNIYNISCVNMEIEIYRLVNKS